jgi:hypothetical protein
MWLFDDGRELRAHRLEGGVRLTLGVVVQGADSVDDFRRRHGGTLASAHMRPQSRRD